MRLFVWLTLTAVVVGHFSSASGEEPIDRRFVELAVDGVDYQGRKWCSDNEFCWLLGRDGKLHCLTLSEVTAFRQLGPIFRPSSTSELRKQLVDEFGKSFEVEASGQHVVVAPKGQSRGCLTVVDATAKSFQAFYNRRNIKLDKVETPLITIVFPTQKEFMAYCGQDQLKKTNGLRGYYHPTTNRVALYLDSPPGKGPTKPEQAPVIGAQQYGTFRDTLAHETTHQLGFNGGLHSRFGDDPVWLVEGMAMLFEGDANRDDSKKTTTAFQRVNRERFVWFLEYKATRRKQHALEEFVASDYLFTDQTLDAYSEAWALTFFLAESRPSQLAGYLKKLANRTETGSYTPGRRLDDFKASFGRDLLVLETQYLKFMQGLESESGLMPTKPVAKAR